MIGVLPTNVYQYAGHFAWKPPANTLAPCLINPSKKSETQKMRIIRESCIAAVVTKELQEIYETAV